MKTSLRISILIFALFSAVACGKSKSSDGGGEDNKANNVNPPPGGGGGITVPKITLSFGTCNKGGPCEVHFNLNAAQAMEIEFEWKTDDSSTAGLPALPAGTIYAQPNVHYTPTSGTLKYTVGSVKVTGVFPNISTVNDGLYFRFEVKNCKIGGVVSNCSSLF